MISLPPKILVITGPTATGKTALAVLLAQKYGGEVVSADSMQLYRKMDIGTAKPSQEELGTIRHHMIDVADPDESYSVSRYTDEAAASVDDILSRGKLPIVAGGTGLYIDSLISGRFFAEFDEDGSMRDGLSAKYDAVGGEKMLGTLGEIDPDSVKRLHPRDKKRIVRALEVYYATGKTITEHNHETLSLPPRYAACKIALSFADREDLYARINARVDDMMSRGLREEVSGLLAQGLTPRHTSMQAIGYKEIAAALEGRYTMDEAVEVIKMQSRRYAKRQLTWLRRDKAVNWILWEKYPNFEKGQQISTEFLEKYGII